jgi:hypothetical protein
LGDPDIPCAPASLSQLGADRIVCEHRSSNWRNRLEESANLSTEHHDPLVERKRWVDGAEARLESAPLQVERTAPHVFYVFEVVVDGSKRDARSVGNGLGCWAHLAFGDELEERFKNFGLRSLASKPTSVGR